MKTQCVLFSSPLIPTFYFLFLHEIPWVIELFSFFFFSSSPTSLCGYFPITFLLLSLMWLFSYVVVVVFTLVVVSWLFVRFLCLFDLCVRTCHGCVVRCMCVIDTKKWSFGKGELDLYKVSCKKTTQKGWSRKLPSFVGACETQVWTWRRVDLEIRSRPLCSLVCSVPLFFLLLLFELLLLVFCMWDMFVVFIYGGCHSTVYFSVFLISALVFHC